ncbi:NACHT and WD repeat domain-containing protein 2-like isoform X1 [Mytilus trossulus]|uniref:NACHT and WD repeat domain-containing protein 2-like isoform X1 n=2 Tax=Mytilus trossulus TaxID=6551 RepID=UPI0030066514
MDNSRKMSVLRGSLDNLPALNSRVVRIFISSTFTDTYEERNMLMEDVYPKIKAHCKEKHGLEFQVIDMRWGVPEEASDDHMSSLLCLQEIYNCQKVSTGPSFVTFLNQKHGYRPLPLTIVSSEYNLLVQTLIDSGEDSALLVKWYEEDLNAVPPVHVLQPISAVIPDYKSKTPAEKWKEWQPIYNTLGQKLRLASQICFENMKLSEEDKLKYFMSVTEEEISAGLLKLPGNASEQCLCFIRLFEDIDLNDKVAPRFIDMVEIGNDDKSEKQRIIDEEAQKILEKLRDEKVTNKIKDKKTSWSKSIVKWAPHTGIGKDLHESYLKEFGDKFYNSMISLIDKAVTNKQMLLQDGLYTEVLQHATMAKERCAIFHGRETILDKIADYLQRKDKSPLTVYGPSGSGKTSIIAEAARKVQFVKHKDAITIFRFLGTSPDSSNVYRLLHSLCQQIMLVTTGKEPNLPQDIDDLTRLFHKLIREYKSNKPLVILLDSLDQLSKEHAAHKLHWLPKKLPEDVKIVTSTYIESTDIIVLLKSLFSPDSFILVPKLGEELSCKILKSWLDGKNRTLTTEQFNVIENAFTQCSLPIYVKLVFESVLDWRSYTVVDDNSLAFTVKESIIKLFEHLEHKHGKMFVSRAFAYITASNSGLSETELEDILSIDDTLLTDVFRIHVPPITRIPPLLFVRLRHDISSYLVDREVDDTTVFYWYHRQFIEAAQSRYLSDEIFEDQIQSTLADYFIGTWYNKPKPFTYSDYQVKRLKLVSNTIDTDRKISPQPLTFKYIVENREKERFNKRKLNRLPYHLTMAGRIEEVRSMCLFNYDFLSAKIKAVSVQQVLEDFTLSKNNGSTLFSVLKQIQSSLMAFPKTLAIEISGHLTPFLAQKKSSLEKMLVEKCFNVIKSEDMPVPYQTSFTIPHNALMYKFEHEAVPFGSKVVMISKDSKHLLAMTADNDLVSWDLTTGELEKEIRLYDPQLLKMNIFTIDKEKDVCYLCSSYQKASNILIVVNMAACELINTISLSKTYPGVGFADSLKFAVTSDKIFCMYVGHNIDVFDKATGKHLFALDQVPDKFLMLPDEKKALIHEKNSTKFFMYNILNNKIESEFNINEKPKDFILAPVGKEIVVLYRDISLVKVFNIDATEGNVGELVCDVKTLGKEKILSLEFSSNEIFLMLKYNTGVYFWNYKLNKMQHHFQIPDEVKPVHRVTDFFGHLTPDGELFVVAYEGFLVIFSMKTNKVANIIEINRSKSEIFLMASSGEFFVNTSSRGNAISTWRTSALTMNDNQIQPMTMKTAPRYIAIARSGKVAAIRGNLGGELAIFDLVAGTQKFYIQGDIDVMKPTVTWDGKYAVVREYHSDEAVKIFNTTSGALEMPLPLTSLQVKGITTCTTMVAVYVQGDDDKVTYVNLYSVPNGKLLHKLHSGRPSLHDMVFDFTSNEEILIVSSPHLEGDPTVADITAYDVKTGEETYFLEDCRVRFTTVVLNEPALFITQNVRKSGDIVIVVDLQSKKILREGKLENMDSQKDWSSSPDGRFCIDRDRQLYDVINFQFKWKYDAEEEYRKQSTQQTYPRFLHDNHTVIFPNITAGLLKFATIDSPEIKFVCPVHGIPVCLEVTSLGMIIVGCDDGRVMMLHKSNKDDIVTAAGLDGVVKREAIRIKKQPKQKTNKSSVCTII